MPYRSPMIDPLATALRGTPAGSFVQVFEQRPTPPALVPPHETPWRHELSQQISTLAAGTLCGPTWRDASYAEAVKAGLLLWNDDLAAAHTLAQRLTHPTGSYWHALMHRREPDYGNSKYWFDRVGDHPIFPELRTLATTTAEALGEAKLATAVAASYEWNPFRFVDWCEAVTREPATAAYLGLVQLDELRLLLLHSFRQATGKA